MIMTAVAEGVGVRTVLGVPLLREGTPIGMFFVMRRTVRPFTERQMSGVDLCRPSGDRD